MRYNAFSLVELVVAVVILGLLAALAIPRLSQGAVNPREAELKTNLAVLRTAIEMYYHDHGVYPAQRPAGLAPAEAGTSGAFIRQLTGCTDEEGCVGEVRDDRFCHGPYLRDGVPACPVSPEGPHAGVQVISGEAVPAYIGSARGIGWVYNCDTGYLAANSPGQDTQGVRYDSY
jgi:prepilin-type N-terminal cleavage/methylation domain-containing protein